MGFLPLVLLACGGADVEPQSHFVGRWLIEETVPHATYGGASFEFHADGSVELLWEAGIYPYPEVSDGAVRCGFGDTWSSSGDLLTVAGVCDDGVARDLTIDLAGEPWLVSPEGWQPPQWGWSFRKCTDDEDCVGIIN